jgi:hypothetical protein
MDETFSGQKSFVQSIHPQDEMNTIHGIGLCQMSIAQLNEYYSWIN